MGPVQYVIDSSVYVYRGVRLGCSRGGGAVARAGRRRRAARGGARRVRRALRRRGGRRFSSCDFEILMFVVIWIL